MLDLCTTGTHGVFVSMHETTQAELTRFIAGSVELFLRQRHLRPANAIRGEDLDQIRPGCFLFSDERANLVRRAALLALSDQRLSGGENTWTRQCTFCNGVTQRQIRRRTDALHRGEAGH